MYINIQALHGTAIYADQLGWWFGECFWGGSPNASPMGRAVCESVHSIRLAHPRPVVPATRATGAKAVSTRRANSDGRTAPSTPLESSGVERVEAEGTGRSFGELDEKPPLKKGVDKRWAELSRGEWIS